MEFQPPLLSMAEAEDQGELSLEEQFAQILLALMRDDVSAAAAIHAFEQASVAMMQQYREASSALLHRAAHYLHTRRLASELEGQAASWHLLHALYCSGDNPAGNNLAGAADAGGRQTLREMTAALVNSNTQLRRLAQVVCWLESLAAQQLQDAPAARFAHHEGLWRETLLSFGLTAKGSSSLSAGGAAGVIELDPDAPSRGKVKLSQGDFRGEERLASHLWQLIRAGKLREARLLCCQAGQAWRCMSLAGGGEWGPLPVGAAAAEAAEQIDQQAAAEELACQVDGGVASAKLAWKWACYAAAEAAAGGTPGNCWEAAVYGALCGHVTAMLPVCASWEDEMWSYCRAWLDLQTDAMLLEGVEHQLPGAAQHMLGAAASPDDLVSPELLAQCVSQAAASGYSSSTDTSLLRDGLAVMAGAWPLNRQLSENERTLLPRNFSELMQLVSNSANTAVRGAARQQQHVLQLQVIAEDWPAITLELAGAALTAAEQLQQLQAGQQALLQQRRQQQQAGDGDADEGMEVEDAAGLLAGTAAGGDDESARVSEESARSVLRFAAHWALCLRALGLMPAHEWSTDEEEEAEWARLQAMLGKVIYQYALHLAQQQDTLQLAPLYLCHLRLGLRESLLQTLLAAATDVLDDEQCQALYVQLLAATEEWRQRQQRLQELVLVQGKQPGPWWDVGDDDDEGVEALQLQEGMMGLAGSGAEEQGRLRQPSSCLFGDLRPQELRLLLQHLVSSGFASSSTSPQQRCQQLRWLFYSFTGALAQQQHAALSAAAAAAPDASDPAAAAAAAALLTSTGDLAWQDIWGDALNHALGLASELVLNPGFSSAGLQVLFDSVVPLEFVETAANVAAAQLSSATQQLQVQRQLQALGFWQRYVELDSRYQQWKEDWSVALAAVEDAAVLNQLAEQGQALAGSMLQQALQDELRLPASAELLRLLADTAAAEAAGDDESAAAALAAAGVDLDEGEWMALPKHDDGEETPSELLLALTVAREGSSGGEPDQPFVQLEAHHQERLQQQLQQFLQAATSMFPDVAFETALADPDSDLAGSVLVTLTSHSNLPDSSAPAEERARFQRRMEAAWQDATALVARMLSSSSATADAAAAAELPRLCLVHMSGSCSTRLALCRRRTTSKLLRRTGKVLLELARAGHPSSQLDALISAAGDAAGRDGPQLLGLLSPGDAGKLLVLLEQAIEEGGLLEEGADAELLLQH
uniref:Nuclear pore complex protein n=1 Tax=Tetradesmus obliquus TaxID=3088 RepID=A0A383W4J3_TETOB|eukprot:jgi/Sobl393_1/18991/SZX72565.1